MLYSLYLMNTQTLKPVYSKADVGKSVCLNRCWISWEIAGWTQVCGRSWRRRKQWLQSHVEEPRVILMSCYKRTTMPLDKVAPEVGVNTVHLLFWGQSELLWFFCKIPFVQESILCLWYSFVFIRFLQMEHFWLQFAEGKWVRGWIFLMTMPELWSLLAFPSPTSKTCR